MTGQLSQKIIKRAKDWSLSLGEDLRTRRNEPDLPLKMLPGLSEKLWLKTREMVVVGARTSQFKSSFVSQMCWDWATQGIPVVYLSLEMTAHSLMERLFCLDQTIPNTSIRRGGFDTHHEAWMAFRKRVDNAKLMIAEGYGSTWRELDEVIDLLISGAGKPAVVVLDYIQCIKGAGLEKREVIDEFIANFRRSAIEHDYLAVCVSQINRASENAKSHEPALYNLKSSGFLEEIADKCILLHHPHFYDNAVPSDQFRIHLAKNRTGSTGLIENVRVIPEFFKFEEGLKVQPDRVESYGPKVVEAVKTFKAKEIREVTRYGE